MTETSRCLWGAEPGCLHWLGESVQLRFNKKMNLTVGSYIDLMSTLLLSCSSVLLPGEGIWHYFPAGPVAHHHASAHQENHTGWGERSLLNYFIPHSLSKSLASSFLPWASQFHFSTICIDQWPRYCWQTGFLSFHMIHLSQKLIYVLSAAGMDTSAHCTEKIAINNGTTGRCVCLS